MKMKSCTADEFSRVVYGAGGMQTRGEGGCTHRTLYWERPFVKGEGWQLVGIKRTMRANAEYQTTYEVPNFLYEAYIK